MVEEQFKETEQKQETGTVQGNGAKAGNRNSSGLEQGGAGTNRNRTNAEQEQKRSGTQLEDRSEEQENRNDRGQRRAVVTARGRRRRRWNNVQEEGQQTMTEKQEHGNMQEQGDSRLYWAGTVTEKVKQNLACNTTARTARVPGAGQYGGDPHTQ